MKKIYVLSIVLFGFLFFSCSKDFLKSYDTRVVGKWRISDINRIGFGGNTSNLPFTDGTFTFYANGRMEYLNSANTIFKGSWDIVKKTRNKETVHGLQIMAVDFTNQEVLSQYYDDMNFLGTDHFKASVNSNFHSFITHFRR